MVTNETKLQDHKNSNKNLKIHQFFENKWCLLCTQITSRIIYAFKKLLELLLMGLIDKRKLYKKYRRNWKKSHIIGKPIIKVTKTTNCEL